VSVGNCSEPVPGDAQAAVSGQDLLEQTLWAEEEAAKAPLAPQLCRGARSVSFFSDSDRRLCLDLLDQAPTFPRIYLLCTCRAFCTPCKFSDLER